MGALDRLRQLDSRLLGDPPPPPPDYDPPTLKGALAEVLAEGLAGLVICVGGVVLLAALGVAWKQSPWSTALGVLAGVSVLALGLLVAPRRRGRGWKLLAAAASLAVGLVAYFTVSCAFFGCR